MKYIFLITLLLSAQFTAAQSLEDRFNSALEDGNDSLQRHLLDQWALSQADDPERYIAEFNYGVNMARNEVIAMLSEPGENDGFVIKDSLGNDVGFMGTQVTWDSTYILHASTFITKGIEAHPDRLDMRFGYIHFLGQLEAWDPFVEQIKAAILQSGVNNNNWLWAYNETFEEASDFVEFLQDYQVVLFEKGDPELLSYNEAIAQAILAQYTAHIPSITNLGVIAYYREDLTSARDYFQQAIDLDPSDMIVVFNLAYIYETLGDLEKAKATYALALKSEDSAIREEAQNILESLEQQNEDQ